MQWVENFYEVLKIHAPAFLQYISSVYDLSLGFQGNFFNLGNVQANQFYVALFACTYPKFYVFKQVTLKP